MWSVVLLGFELSVKKVASGKFFSAGVKASIDPQRNANKAEQILPPQPSHCGQKALPSVFCCKQKKQWLAVLVIS